MTADEAVVAVVDTLEAVGIRSMIVGSLASNFYGIPRSTRDADFVVELPPAALSRLEQALPENLRLRSQVAFEAVTGTVRYVIEMADGPFLCELFVLSDDPHDRLRFSRRLKVRMFGREVFVASAEDTIVTKLRWAHDAHRAKDREDVRNIIALREASLDWQHIEAWAATHGTLGLLEEIRRAVPPGTE